jgi:hypothetical protein
MTDISEMTAKLDPKQIEEAVRRSEYDMKVFTDIYERRFDAVILVNLYLAAIQQSHASGLEDAAWLCEKLAKAWNDNPAAMRLAKAIRELIAENAMDNVAEKPFT